MKTLVKVLIVLVAILGIGLVGAYLARNVIAASVIRNAASMSLGVPVDVDSVELEIWDRKVTLNGLAVGNPPGYTEPNVLTAGKIFVALNATEVSTEKVVVDEVTINNVGVWFIGKGSTSNVSEVMEKLSGSKDESGKTSGGAPVEVVIKKLVLTDIHAHYSMGGAMTDLPNVPRIELTNISSKGGADDIYAQLSEKIFSIALQATFDSVGKQLPAELSSGIGKSLEGAGVVIGEAAKAIGKAGEEAGKAIGGAAKGIGDLFGGKKE